MTVTRLALGRKVNHDSRSRNYPARRATQLRSVLWTHNAPVLDQGDVGGCTGFALTQLLNTTPFATSRPQRRYLTAQHALQLYSAATGEDEFGWTYPPTDNGSSGLGVCKAGQRLGYLSRYEHAFGLDHMLAALQLQPVIVGTAWYEGMTWMPAERGSDRIARPEGKDLGGHEYLCIGADLSRHTLQFINSWGPDWPIRNGRGRFRISFADFERLLADQVDVTVPIGLS